MNERTNHPAHADQELDLEESGLDDLFAASAYSNKLQPSVENSAAINLPYGRRTKPPVAAVVIAVGCNLLAVFAVMFIMTTSSMNRATFDDPMLWKSMDRGQRRERQNFAQRVGNSLVAVDGADRVHGLDSKEYAEAVNQLSDVYMDSGHWSDATKWLHGLVHVYPRIGLSDRLPEVNAQLAYAYWMLHHDSQALFYSQEAVRNDPPLAALGDKFFRS